MKSDQGWITRNQKEGYLMNGFPVSWPFAWNRGGEGKTSSRNRLSQKKRPETVEILKYLLFEWLNSAICNYCPLELEKLKFAPPVTYPVTSPWRWGIADWLFDSYCCDFLMIVLYSWFLVKNRCSSAHLALPELFFNTLQVESTIRTRHRHFTIKTERSISSCSRQ